MVTTPLAPQAPEPVLLVLADISGYTRYMTANAKTLAHSQTIITELVAALIQAAELPLEVAKLEGDAVFLVCRKQGMAEPWSESKRKVRERLLSWFDTFRQTLQRLEGSTTCTCRACAHLHQLRLKIVVHSGWAVFHRVLHFTEWAGLDVIVVHRLLKNAVGSAEYLLLTEAAHADLEYGGRLPLVHSAEEYEEIGCIGTRVYVPAQTAGASERIGGHSSVSRLGSSAVWLAKLWFGPLRKRKPFLHLPSQVRRIRRAGFAFLTLLLTPVYLPVGLAGVWLRSWVKLPNRGTVGRRATADA